MEKKRITIVIDGQTYNVISDEDELHVLRVAQAVDHQIQMIKEKAAHLSPTMTAVLGAMNLSDELIKLREGAAETAAVKERDATIADLKVQLENLNREVEKHRERLEASDEQVLFLQRKITEKQEQIEQLNQRPDPGEAVGPLEKRIRDLESQLADEAGLKRRIETLTAENKEKSDLIASLEAQLAEAPERQLSLVERIPPETEALEEALEEARRQLEASDEKVFYLQRKLTDKEEELQGVKKELEDFIDEFEQS